MAQLHADELAIDISLVERLIASQLPHYKSERLSELATTGSTNRLFRLGQDMLVRLPRQPGQGQAIKKEEIWTSRFRSQLPVLIPEIRFIGEPEHAYSESWSVVTWIDGEHPQTAKEAGIDEQRQLATDLARVIRAIREQKVPRNIDESLRWYRGGALKDFDTAVRKALKKCEEIVDLDLDLALAAEVWDQAMTMPRAQVAQTDCWYHADLVAENLLVSEGSLHAVLDWGVMGVGDPAVDLHGAWELLGTEARALFRRKLGVEQEDWACARAWALGIAVTCFSYYWQTMPKRCAQRLIMAQSVLDEALNEPI